MRGPAFRRALDEIGAAVVGGGFPAGSRTSVEALVDRTAASRSVVREATRVLTALGLLSASPRVGLVVQPVSAWNLLDPHVVRWRLAGPGREEQLRELRELRAAVEPAAARAAATRATPPARARLRELAHDLAPTAAFGALDAELHDLVLRSSGNALFVDLARLVALAVGDRAGLDPDPHDVALHAALARAVADADPAAAEAAVREVVARTQPSESTTVTSGA